MKIQTKIEELKKQLKLKKSEETKASIRSQISYYERLMKVMKH